MEDAIIKGGFINFAFADFASSPTMESSKRSGMKCSSIWEEVIFPAS